MTERINRRKVLTGAAASLGALPLAGCDLYSQNPTILKILDSAERLTESAQRLFLSQQSLAPEFTEADISPHFRANGSTDPDDPSYQSMAQSGFADWQLEVGGLVDHPLQLSLRDLRAMPSRTQITRHDCVEGWSVIGKWRGAQLRDVIAAAQPLTGARYVVFWCMDDDGSGTKYYESLDMHQAIHPQAVLAYELNGEVIPPKNGAPIRLTVPTQLGYKSAKHVQKIEVVAGLGGNYGRGGYWEDRGYEWFAGI